MYCVYKVSIGLQGLEANYNTVFGRGLGLGARVPSSLAAYGCARIRLPGVASILRFKLPTGEGV